MANRGRQRDFDAHEERWICSKIVDSLKPDGPDCAAELRTWIREHAPFVSRVVVQENSMDLIEVVMKAYRFSSPVMLDKWSLSYCGFSVEGSEYQGLKPADRNEDACHFLCWRLYLQGIVSPLTVELEYFPPISLGRVDLLRKELHTFMSEQQPERYYQIARHFVKGVYMVLASENRFLRKHPGEQGFLENAKVLEFDHPSEEERAEIAKQLSLIPRKADHATQITPIAKQQWVLGAYVNRFEQKHKDKDFCKSYLIHWREWGSVTAHERLRTKQRHGRQTLPLVLHLGEDHWRVRDQQNEKVSMRLKDVVEALVLWETLVRERYEGRLEDDTRLVL